MHRRARVVVLPLAGLLALGACGSDAPTTVDTQLVAACMGPTDDSTGTWRFEITKDGETVGGGTVPPLGSVTVEVPLGTVVVTGNGTPLATGGSDQPSPADAEGHAEGTPFYVKGDPDCPDVSAVS